VEGLGTIRSINREQNAVLLEVGIPKELAALIVWKGSVAVDGVSLTIQALTAESFTVSLIPHTFAVTRFSQLKVGSSVNVETDMMAKHAIQTAEVTPKKELTLEFLKANGFA
jgi:riboflavin synthase